jgi:hypothetical protein
MTGFRRNPVSFQWIPVSFQWIPPDSAGIRSFRQESVGQ